MSRTEASPLLQGAAPTNTYRTLSTDSMDSLGPAELSTSAILSTYTKFEKSLKPERLKQSSLVTIFSVWNTIMGSSLLTMAWGVERAGLPAALILVAFMAALCLYTAYVLLRVNKHHGSDTCEVPALCRTLLGRWAEVLAHMFSLLVLLGANIVYWILITNFLYFTVNYFVDLHSSNTTEYSTSLLCPRHVNETLMLAAPAQQDDSSYWGLHTTVPLYVALIVFPLLNFKNVSFFTKFNSLGTLSVIYLLIFVMVKGYAWGVNIGTIFSETHALKNAAVLSGMLALSFYIHNIIITIMSNNARQDKNGRDLTIAFLLVTVTYTLVGAVFYVCFPLAKSCIEDNLLNNFEMHDVMTAVARILLLFQVVTVYPLVAFMLRSEAILLMPFKESRLLTVTINVSIMTMCILVACFCPSIGTIISHLEYASQVWNPNYNIYINRLEAIQRKFLRYIQYRSNCYLPNYYSRCKKFHLLPLQERRKIADLSLLLSVANGSMDVSELLSKIGLRVPSAFLRKPQLLHTPTANTTYRQNSFVIRASRTFNAACRSVDLDLFTSSNSQLKKILCATFFGD